MVFGKSVQFEALLLFIILFFIQKINKGPLDAPIFSGFIKLWCQKLIKKQQGHLGKHPSAPQHLMAYNMSISKTKTYIICLLALYSAFIFSCKKTTEQTLDFSQYTQTNSECSVIGTPDSISWTNAIFNLQQDTPLLNFADNLYLTDTLAAVINITPPCPDPSNGFFIWHVNSSGPCKLRLVCVDINSDVLYYNAYLLQGGPLEIAFDFRNKSAFQANTNYRMYYGFYTSRDSIFYSGYGDFRIE